jgi:hypothetical protein
LSKFLQVDDDKYILYPEDYMTLMKQMMNFINSEFSTNSFTFCPKLYCIDIFINSSTGRTVPAHYGSFNLVSTNSKWAKSILKFKNKSFKSLL